MSYGGVPAEGGGVVYVDFCGTLYQGQSLGEYLKLVSKMRGPLYKATDCLTRILDRVFPKIGSRRSLLRFVPEADLIALARRFGADCGGRLCPGVLSYVSEFQAHGHAIVIVSASFREIIESVPWPFPIEAVLATSVTQHEHPMVYGVRKAAAILEYERGLEVSPRYRIAIADHPSDRPVFGLADISFLVDRHQRTLSVV